MVLNDTGFGPKAVKVIAEMVLSMPEVSHLELTKNNLKDEGALILAQVFEMAHHLVHVDLRANEIGNDGFLNLCTAIGHSPSITSALLGNTHSM